MKSDVTRSRKISEENDLKKQRHWHMYIMIKLFQVFHKI